MKRLTKAIPFAAAAILVQVMMGTPASAKPIEKYQGDDRTGLRVGKFDSEVAKLNGYQIVTLPDGSLDSVPKGQAAAAAAGALKPTGAVIPPAGSMTTMAQSYKYGECGYSFVFLTSRGGGAATLGTGAHVRLDWNQIWDVNWRVNITDNGGSSQQTGYSDNGGWDFFPPNRILHLTPGYATAGVPFYAYVILTDGTVCYSYSPVVTELIR
jgi:hypothetical protein